MKMRLYRKPRVFVSYNYEDTYLRERICEHLTEGGLSVVYDTRLQAGDSLDKTLKKLIKQADAIMAIGTRKFMESKWCCWEVSYAVELGKHYCPLMFPDKDGTPIQIPDWFKGVLPTVSRKIVYVEINNPDESENWLPNFCRWIHRHRPYKPAWLVSLATAVFILVPFAFAIAVRLSMQEGFKDVLAAQKYVEIINTRVIEGTGIVRFQKSGSVLYFDALVQDGRNKNVPIARDSFYDGKIIHREFLQSGRTIAHDEFSSFPNSQGDITFRKKRRIFRLGGASTVIEDHFDAGGRLACKIVSDSDNKRGRIVTYETISQYPNWIWTSLYR